MRPKSRAMIFLPFAVILGACGSAAGGEPSESQMREAALYAINHPPGIANADPGVGRRRQRETSPRPSAQDRRHGGRRRTQRC